MIDVKKELKVTENAIGSLKLLIQSQLQKKG